MKVGTWEQILDSLIYPLGLGEILALGAVPVSARVIGNFRKVAPITLSGMLSKLFGSTSSNRTNHLMALGGDSI
jgi:hypothetical protein